ncbi:MAG: ethanolamine utilization protein EutJ [Deltaproteobacteria bacterium]|nr:MAG: ethanolamine utilization protein EutJ [Deltaproteobacteria bacterium]
MISKTANQRITDFEAALALNGSSRPGGDLYTGVDLGTAYIVTAVVNGKGAPVAGVLTRSQSSIRDGLVLDYVGAITILRYQVDKLRTAGFPIQAASAAYPPGTVGRNAQAFGNVLQAVGLNVEGLVDEPTAASLVLEITEGAVVDIGGGTTGISVVKNGEVVYTADEPTGGVHVDLVLAGHFGIEVQEAETMKRDLSRQDGLFPLVRPVFQKMATIVRQHLRGGPVETLYLVGGTSSFPGIEEVMAEETGLSVARPCNPLLVTPLGIALNCAQRLRHES